MNTLKKLQKNIVHNGSFKKEIGVVYFFRNEGKPSLVATDSFKLVEVNNLDLTIQDKVNKLLPKIFYFNKDDVAKIKNFSGKMVFTDFEPKNKIIFYMTFSNNGKIIEKNGMLRIGTDLSFVKGWEKLFDYKPISISEAKYNYKYLSGIGEILSDSFSGMKFRFGKQTSGVNVMIIDGEKGRAIVMPMNED